MGELRGKDYILDSSELQAWSSILEEPIHSDGGEGALSGHEPKEEPFDSESRSVALVDSELSIQPLIQHGPGVRSRVPDEAWPAIWRDALGDQVPSSDYILSLAAGQYLNELSEGSKPLKENFKANQGCWDRIPDLVDSVRDLVSALSSNTSAASVGVREALGVGPPAHSSIDNGV